MGLKRVVGTFLTVGWCLHAETNFHGSVRHRLPSEPASTLTSGMHCMLFFFFPQADLLPNWVQVARYLLQFMQAKQGFRGRELSETLMW